MIKIINFRGDLTDNSAKKEALVGITCLPWLSYDQMIHWLLSVNFGDREDNKCL